MSKRKGRKPLDLDNLDDDSEPEEAGTMVRASEEVVRNRVVRVAKRRLNKPSEGGVFGSLKPAFNLQPQSTANLQSTFAFLKNSNPATSTPLPGTLSATGNFNPLIGKQSSNLDRNSLSPLNNSPVKKEANFSFKRKCTDVDDAEPVSKQNSLMPTPQPHLNGSSSSGKGDSKMTSSVAKELFLEDSSSLVPEQVKILNIECLQWAQQHVDENPLVDLRPVFKDYNQHFEAILEEFKKSEVTKPKESNASLETLAKLQNHIKNKNLESSKALGKKLEDNSSITNDILSPESNAEMKSKISNSLNRLSYFSSLLAGDSEPSKATKDDVTSPKEAKTSVPSPNSSPNVGLKTKPFTDTAPAGKSPSELPSNQTNNSFTFSKSSSPASFSFGNSAQKSNDDKPASFSFGNSAPKTDDKPPAFSFGNAAFKNDSKPPAFSFGNLAPKSDDKLTGPLDSNKSDEKSPSEASDFFKIPALKNNCFSNPSLFNKESTSASTELIGQKSIFSNSTASSLFSTPASNNFASTQSKEESEENEDAEDQPPVVEVKPIIEEGAKYTARCKVFVKKDDNSYADKGVGTLSLKPLENSDKSQLVVRTETALGNILVNLVLSKDIPIQRTGKNNVLLVCLPTPEYEPPPKVMLLRVKTAEEADELLKVLQDNQA